MLNAEIKNLEVNKMSDSTERVNEGVIWSDKKRILGLPISFTKYSLIPGKFIIQSGLLNSTREMIMLYRILDIKLERTLGQKIFGVGSIFLYTNDKTSGDCIVKNIKNPEVVMDLISDKVEEERKSQRIRATELMDGDFDNLS